MSAKDMPCKGVAKDTWTDLVHSFEGLSDTKENMIMDLKLKYQTFRAKSSKTLSQTYTHYKTLLNELANDGVTLSKHEINDFQENSDDKDDKRTSEEYLRDLDIEFHKRALMANSKHFIKRKNNFSSQKANQDTKCSKGGKKEFHIVDFDPFVSFFILLSKFFYIIKSIIPNKDYKTEYKKLKAKLALFEASPPTSLSSKPFQPKNKGLVAETFDWVEEEVSNDEEETQVKVLMALADDELSVGKNHAHNGEWIDITMKKVNILLSMDEDSDWQNYLKYIHIDLKYVEEQRLNLLSKYNKIVFELNKCRDDLLVLKQVKLKADTFQIQNTELTKLNRALYDQLNEERKVNEKWLNSSNKVSQCISEQIPNQKKKIIGGEHLTDSSFKNDAKDNLFVPASLDYDHEMVLKSKDWVERLNPNRKLPNFNTGRILVPESSESQTPLPSLKNLQGASPSSELMTLTYQYHSPREIPGLETMKHTNPETQESSHKNFSGPLIISDPELVTSSVPTEVKTNDQDSKINVLTKLRHIREPIWYLDSGCSRSMTGVKIYRHKYVEQLGPKVVFGDNSPCITEGYGSINCGGIVFSKMVKNKNDVNVKQIRTDNRTEFRNTRLESFYDEKGISQNFSSPYTPEQNGIAKRKTKTLIEAARTILNGSVLSKHLWTEAVRIACYTQNRSIIKFDAKSDDGYFLGYSFNSKAFRVFNTKRQQIKETYHVTSDERIEVIRFTNTSVDEIGIGDLSRYPPDEFLQEDDPSRQYQTNSDISYYIIPHGRLLTELTQEKHVSEVIALNEQDNPKTEDVECNAPT
ncbi:retrovirus-related pol polyprotein from transposon TNT 1-94 [Tanacetum coccineum]